MKGLFQQAPIRLGGRCRGTIVTVLRTLKFQKEWEKGRVLTIPQPFVVDRICDGRGRDHDRDVHVHDDDPYA